MTVEPPLQTTPDPSPSPPRVVAKNPKRNLSLLLLLGLIVVVGLGWLLFSIYSGFRQSKATTTAKIDRITARMNAKKIGIALVDFDAEYGAFPDKATAAVIKRQTKSDWTLGVNSSNELFQQLFAANIAVSEEIFFLNTPWSRKPDDVFATEAQALASGECGFAYISGLSSINDERTPLCVAPLEPGKLTFDRDALDGNAVVLMINTSVIELPIDKSGHAILNGMDLFDPRQPFWHGKAPNVKWPK